MTRKISPVSSFRIEQSLPFRGLWSTPGNQPIAISISTTKLLSVVTESSLLHRTNWLGYRTPAAGLRNLEPHLIIA